MPQLQPQLFTPPPAYQYLITHPYPVRRIYSNNLHHLTDIRTKRLYLCNSQHLIEIPQPSSTSTSKQPLIPSVKLLDIQNPPPIDFDQLKLTANKMHNRSHSLDILRNDDQPHTNEVTYCDSHSADTYEV